MEILLVFLVVVLVLLLWQSREHLTPTPSIRAPTVEVKGMVGKQYDQAEQDRILKLVPGIVERATDAVIKNIPSPTAQQKQNTTNMVKFLLPSFVAGFYEKVYAPSKVPITEKMITDFVDRDNAKNPMRNQFVEILKAYFLPAPAKPTVAAPAASTRPAAPAAVALKTVAPVVEPKLAERQQPAFPQPTTFDTAVEAYQKNYTEYKITGNAAFKVAYENAEAWVRNYLNRLKQQADGNNRIVGDFVRNYEKTNPELVALQKDMKGIRTEGPRLEDKYETEKRIYEQAPPDLTSFYVKGVIAAALLGIGAAILVF